ncbi:MAG: HAD-IB family phosphatase [Ignavibacteriae bacterium]|nr:HAD-IB family phosphatase [Ignavibacteriota bacterium]
MHVADPDLSTLAGGDTAHRQLADTRSDKQSATREYHRLRIYCDFDGTIVREDVGDRFFSTFSGPEMWNDNASFMAGDITIDEVFTRYTDRMRGITPEHVDTWSAQFTVEPGFVDFVHWCAAQEYPLSIVSDGLDAYILPILLAASVDVPVYANRLVYREGGRCIVRRPWADEFCARCGTCKRNRMLTLTPDDDIIVLIGDGFSDFCAAQYADIVFARDALETYCQRENISFRRFSSFDNIRAQLTALADRKRIRKPRRAALARADVWAGE